MSCRHSVDVQYDSFELADQEDALACLIEFDFIQFDSSKLVDQSDGHAPRIGTLSTHSVTLQKWWTKVMCRHVV